MAEDSALAGRPDVVSAAALATFWACSVRQVQLMAKEGVAIRGSGGRDRYVLAQSTQNYILHLRKQAEGRAGKNGADPVQSNITLRDAKTRLLNLQIAKAEQTQVSVDDVRFTWDHINRAVRQWALSLPTKIVFACPMLTNTDAENIRRLVRDGLEDLALNRGTQIVSADGTQVVQLPAAQPQQVANGPATATATATLIKS